MRACPDLDVCRSILFKHHLRFPKRISVLCPSYRCGLLLRDASISYYEVVFDTAKEPIRRRRRGQQLEIELLDAGWDELVEVGFANLTMESIAQRAHTGVAVLYRRWTNKDQLVLAAIDHYRSNHAVELPETGTLRGDLLAALTGMGDARAPFFFTVVAAVSAGLLTETGLTPNQMRDKVMGDQRLTRVRSIYQRAHNRGEIDLGRIPPAVLVLPFDLMRHDLLMGLKPLKMPRLKAILDEIVLPLIFSYHPKSR
jgi:AcrR family transcriptional regulator